MAWSSTGEMHVVRAQSHIFSATAKFRLVANIDANVCPKSDRRTALFVFLAGSCQYHHRCFESFIYNVANVPNTWRGCPFAR